MTDNLRETAIRRASPPADNHAVALALIVLADAVRSHAEAMHRIAAALEKEQSR